MVTMVLVLLSAASLNPSDDVQPNGPLDAGTAVSSDVPEVPNTGRLAEGIWPSEKLTRSLLVRWADGISVRFDLDAAGREQVRKMTVDRWGRFLKDNRADLQPLLNEFFEMRLAVEPPSAAEVRRWADRALPAFQRMETQARETTAEFREIIPPEKRVQFEAEAVKLGLGLQIASQKLEQWKKGEYEQNDVWQPPRSARRSRSESRDEKRHSEKAAPPRPDSADPEAGTEGEPPDQIAGELQRWDAFVGEVVRLHEYDKAQESAAQSFLSELKGRAIAHRERHRDDIAQLENRIRDNSGTDEAVAQITKDLITLYGPIDEMFKDLKTRVTSIATTDQKIRAAAKRKKQNATDERPSEDEKK